jgi:hypothetical protein
MGETSVLILGIELYPARSLGQKNESAEKEAPIQQA